MASQALEDKAYREGHAMAVAHEKEARGGKQAYDARRKDKLARIKKEEDDLKQARKEKRKKAKMQGDGTADKAIVGSDDEFAAAEGATG